MFFLTENVHHVFIVIPILSSIFVADNLQTSKRKEYEKEISRIG